MRITAQSMGNQSYMTYKIANRNSTSGTSSSVNSILSNLSSSTTTSSSDMTDLAAQMSNLKANRSTLSRYYSNLSTSDTSKVTSKANAQSSAASTAKNLKTLETAASGLSEDAIALASNGRDSVFKADSEGNYDMEKVASAVSDFVTSYNSTKTAVVNAGNEKAVQTAVSMVNSTQSVEASLNKVGITINKDNSLSVDTAKLKESDVADIKSLFSGTGSYAYNVATKASQIESYAATGTGSLFSGYSKTAGSIIDMLA